MADACIYWTGRIDASGYGRYGAAAAHRMAYEKHVGPIPEGFTIDHLCHNSDGDCRSGSECMHRRCINPNHLEAVTWAENSRRANQSRRTCRNGHEWTPENTGHARTTRGYTVRVCRACDRERQRRYQERKRVKTP